VQCLCDSSLSCFFILCLFCFDRDVEFAIVLTVHFTVFYSNDHTRDSASQICAIVAWLRNEITKIRTPLPVLAASSPVEAVHTMQPLFILSRGRHNCPDVGHNMISDQPHLRALIDNPQSHLPPPSWWRHSLLATYARVLRLSVVCNVCIVAKQWVKPKNRLKEQITNGMENRMVTWPMTSHHRERSTSWPQYA